MAVIKTTSQLLENHLVSKDDCERLSKIADQYAIGISENMVSCIVRPNEEDPIYKQFVPSANEEQISQYELNDPISDEKFSPVTGLVHRYTNRALVKITSSCPVYCRFCFRREMVGRAKSPVLSNSQIAKIVEYIAAHKEINEVIFSGGDPLGIGSRRLEQIVSNFDKITHVKSLRFHSRVPVVTPSLINAKSISVLSKLTKPVFVVIHINHANELNHDAIDAIKRLRMAGVSLLSQSVLLKGINDDPEVLAQLVNELIGVGIKPYYLHHPDLARGTGHFGLNPIEGMSIYKRFAKLVSGLGKIRYVIDIPGGYGKIDVNEQNVKQELNGHFTIYDENQVPHFYPNIRI